MAISLRGKILAAVVGLVFAMTGTMVFLAQRQTESAMRAVMDASARNLLRAVELNVESEYRSLLFFREAAQENRKAELKNVAALAVNYIEGTYERHLQGELTEDEAKQLAIREIKRFRYDDGVGYIWINDTGRPTPRMVMHPTMPDLDGKVLDDPSFNCALGAGKNLFEAFVDVCLEKGEGYVDYLWPKPAPPGLTPEQPKLSYVCLFKPWDWVVGTGLYIDDIEREAQRRLDAILVELTETFSRVRVGGDGYMFLFTGGKEMLIHPSMVGKDFSQELNPVTGNPILDDLMAAAQGHDRVLRYKWEKPLSVPGERTFDKQAYVAYFAPLDWYICSSVYEDEVEIPGLMLRRRALWLMSVLLIAAFLAALGLAHSLTKPLRELAAAARGIEQGGIFETRMPVSGGVETRELGRVLDTMIGSMRDAMGEKEQLLAKLGAANRELVDANDLLQKEVAERKRAEDEMRRLRNLLKNMFDSMPSVLVGVDTDGKVTQWNLEAERMTGVKTGEAEGCSLADVYPQLGEHMGRVREAIVERRTLREEKIARVNQGEVAYSDVTVYPLVANGVEGAVIRVDDVTARVRLEEIMIQSEKMMSVGGLAAGMAHEINNPLAGILQGIQVIQTRVSPEMKKNRQVAEACGTSIESISEYLSRRSVLAMLDAVRVSGARAARIVENMLSFSRKSESELAEEDLGVLLDKTVELAESDYDLRRKYDFRRIRIVREYEAGTPRVLCEATKIQQVFLNILKNGAEAMAEARAGAGGNDEAPRFVLRVRRERDMVRVEIEDSGPGMPEAARRRVFEPFYTTKGPLAGTGLGLSVSYFIITENHGGAMTVESAPGHGTTFIIRLPVRRKAQSSAGGPQDSVDHGL